MLIETDDRIEPTFCSLLIYFNPVRFLRLDEPGQQLEIIVKVIEDGFVLTLIVSWCQADQICSGEVVASSPEEVDYVNAHAASTPVGDAVEVRAIKTVFCEHAYKVPINSTKSMIGHCLTASGILELIATILQMKHDVVHPTINQEEQDPELDLDFVPNHSREHHIHIALSNAFGFGGLNSCVLIGQAP